MNMIVGILVERFLEEDHKTCKIFLFFDKNWLKFFLAPWFGLTDEQKEWCMIKESVYKFHLKKKSILPNNKIRRFLSILLKNVYFKFSSTVYTLLNGIIYMLYYHRQGDTFYLTLSTLYFNY